MATTFLTTSSTVAAPIATLNASDTFIQTSGAVNVATGEAGIVANGDRIDMAIQGTIAAQNSAISLGSHTAPVVTIGRLGTILSARDSGVYGSGDESSVINHGEIDSSLPGFDLGGARSLLLNHGRITSRHSDSVFMASDDGRIVNYGTIETGVDTVNSGNPEFAIVAFSSDMAPSVENHGFIGSANGNAIELDINAANRLTNFGDIVGRITPGSDGDTVRNSGPISTGFEMGAGDDIHDGRGGRVEGTVDGGTDNDSLRGGSAEDAMHAGAGEDTANGGSGGDSILRGGGNDFLNGNYGADYIFGNDALGGGTRIEFDTGDVLHLPGIAPGALDAGDFLIRTFATNGKKGRAAHGHHRTHHPD